MAQGLAFGFTVPALAAAAVVAAYFGYTYYSANIVQDAGTQTVSAVDVQDITGAGVSESSGNLGDATSTGGTGDDRPVFDIVRVEPDGSAVIAGRAGPGSRVEIRSGSTLLGTVPVNERGEWVFVTEEPLGAGDFDIYVAELSADGTVRKASEQSVAISVGNNGDKPLVVISETGEASRVLQSAEVQTPNGGDVGPRIGVVDMDRDRLILSGTGQPDASLRVYLDNQPVGVAQANDAGLWQLDIENVEVHGGDVMLRVDQVDDQGNVIARAEQAVDLSEIAATKLAALDSGIEVLSDASGGAGGAGGALAGFTRIRITRGDNLWNIARKVYGSGFRYTVIYDANRLQIRNPDLIYPGQVFDIPTPSG